MSEVVTWSPDIDYDTIWFVVQQITNQISGRGIQQLEDKLEEEGLVMTGALKSSLFREVRQNNQSWMTELAMQFEAYGRFKDIKEMTYSQQMPVREGLLQWVEDVMEGKRGKTPFNFISGRKNGSFPVDKEQATRQLAWAIARSRLYQPIVTRKGRGWYIKNYMREIYGEIEVNIQAAAAQAVMNTVTKALKNR
ncbi:hypothetical protein [Dyadobacter sp. CY323]|uniref:hypothetical protein n=1 Tax=Dyadobacter sp. CY323 TaxID=2907302 RepID=UPI001F337BB5|nr:hypothetical protein [Dyadobacter sp. CY323]MCE6987480.1 hypothetical protein [Dyadobacter sp. CY323]